MHVSKQTRSRFVLNTNESLLSIRYRAPRKFTCLKERHLVGNPATHFGRNSVKHLLRYPTRSQLEHGSFIKVTSNFLNQKQYRLTFLTKLLESCSNFISHSAKVFLQFRLVSWSGGWSISSCNRPFNFSRCTSAFFDPTRCFSVTTESFEGWAEQSAEWLAEGSTEVSGEWSAEGSLDRLSGDSLDGSSEWSSCSISR